MKPITMKYCPRCKSTDVRIDITAGAAFGAPQKWQCQNCNFESYAIFPEKEIEQKPKKKKPANKIKK